MHLVLGVVDRHARLDSWSGDDWADFERLVRSRVPVRVAERCLHRWVSPDGGTAIACWGRRDHRLGEHIEVGLEDSTVSTGHWSRRPPSLRQGILTGEGAGNVALLSACSGGLRARTSVSGAEPLYLARGRRLTAISNRAMVAAIVAHGCVEFAPSALPQYICAGFALSQQTPFAGVEGVPRATLVRVRRRRLGLPRVERFSRGPEGPTAARNPDQVGAALAEALVSAMSPLAGKQVELGLTGGKDSRLIAASLRVADIDFTAQTFGPEGHPDVVVARSVAQHLGVPHTHNEPRLSIGEGGQRSIEVDPIERAVSAVLLGEGMISSYENLGRPTDRPPSLVLSGTGGELLRGGYAHFARDLTEGGAQRFLTQGFLRNLDILQHDAQVHLKARLQPWIDRAEVEPREALDQLYREYRMARWASAGRSAYSITRDLVQPLFDSGVVEISSESDIDERISELLIFRALDRLAPQLARHPFAEKRWVFEEHGPHPSLTGWHERQPIRAAEPTAATTASFNWRLHYGSELQAVFRDVVLDPARDHDLFEVLRRDAVESLLAADPPCLQHLSWHLFTVAILLSRIWEAPDPPRAPIRIAVPPAEATSPRADPDP